MSEPLNELKSALTPVDEESQGKAVSPDDVVAAVEQLRRSERGGAALTAFVKMIEAGGGSLDTCNWRALTTLCRACRAGNPYMIAQWVNDTRRARSRASTTPKGR